MSILIFGTGRSGSTALFYALKRAFPDLIQSFETIPSTPIGHLSKIGIYTTKVFEQAIDYEYRIWLTRDPRDRIVSGFLYQLAYHWAFDADRPTLLEIDSILGEKADNPDLPFLCLVDRIRELVPVEIDLWREDVTACKLYQLCGHHFFRYTYEEMIRGETGELRKYLPAFGEFDTTVDTSHDRVKRTMRSGEWRFWFTNDDLAQIIPEIDAPMFVLGYDPNIHPDHIPEVTVEEIKRPFRRLVNQRREQEGMPRCTWPK